jgi:hypothetical protein
VIKGQLQFHRYFSSGFWKGRHLLLPGDEVDEIKPSHLGFGIDDAGVFRVHGGVESVPVRDVHDVGIEDTERAVGPAGEPPGAVVLSPSVDPVGLAVVDTDGIVLPDRKVIDEAPVLAPRMT